MNFSLNLISTWKDKQGSELGSLPFDMSNSWNSFCLKLSSKFSLLLEVSKWMWNLLESTVLFTVLTKSLILFPGYVEVDQGIFIVHVIWGRWVGAGITVLFFIGL